ncbi:MAG: ABC transporter substrate-binding protein [Rubrimonas sp.]
MRRWIATALIALAPAAGSADVLVRSAVLKVERPQPTPLVRTATPRGDEGFQGARVGLADNATTGRFVGHNFENTEVTTTPDEALAALDALIEGGVRFVVTLAEADDLLALADHAAGRDVVLLNAAARDDRLRMEDCRANVLHVTPNRAMLADGLAQYLVWKQWTDWFVIAGSNPPDRLMGDAYRRAATKFGARIVEDREFEDTGGARRSDTGHVLVQRQIPVFTQRARAHHVVVVADESEVFGVYIPYRTWDPRPVAGDAGLKTMNWHPNHESWGATQMQRRFEREAGRVMTELDYDAWAAMRVIGEAVTRTNSDDVATLRDYILSADFQLGAFKGQPLSFRPWDNQLRQAILLADGDTVVSVSPQDEFLHQRTQLDTLGFDEPNTACRF